MSAENLGRRLLAEVEEGSLSELLSSLRFEYTPTSQYTFGIPPLDQLLALFTSEIHLRHHTTEQRTQYPSDRHHHTTPSKPPFIELTSPSTGNGKSQFLYHLLSISVLPTRLSNIPLHGQNSHIIFYDTDSRFCISRLATVFRHHISICVTAAQNNPEFIQPSPTAIENTILDALRSIHVFRPQSLASLTATVEALPEYLRTLDKKACGKKVAALVLDSASAFFWDDRADGEDTAATAAATAVSSTTSATAPPSRKETGYASLLAALKSVSLGLQAPVVYTTWNLASSNSSSSLVSRTAHIWPHTPLLKLRISRKEVRKFPSGMSAEEAHRDRKDRMEVLRRGVFEVRVCGEEGWSERVRRGIREIGGFVVVVSGEGVRVGEE